MGKLIYAPIASLDGYVADAEGHFGWAAPDEEVHLFVNDLQRDLSTHLYGRRMYEVLQVWETMGEQPDQTEAVYDFAQVWKAADKIVYSRTLDQVSTSRTRLERDFAPEAIRALKEQTEGDLSIGGPHLAAQAFRAGLVDELQVFATPVLVGGGNAALPDGLRIDLELLDLRRFVNGTTYQRYAVRS